MRCDKEQFFKELISKSWSENREEAILEWEVIIYTENYYRSLNSKGDIQIKESRLSILKIRVVRNPILKIGDKCKHKCSYNN